MEIGKTFPGQNIGDIFGGGVGNIFDDLDKFADKLPLKKPAVTTDYTFGTFNAYGGKGYDLQSEVDEIGNFVNGTGPQGDAPLDIVGFQEVGGVQPGSQIAGEMARNGMNGYMDEGGNPIYWKASKFDVVHQETLVIHDKNEVPSGPGVPENIGDDRVSDQRRTTTFVVLKDKETGAEMLVTNRHQDHQIKGWNHENHRDAHKAMSNIKADEIMEKFPGISARVDLGDFNEGLSDVDRIGPESVDPDNPSDNKYDTTTDETYIDHILSEGSDFETSAGDTKTHYYEKVKGEGHFNSDSYSHPMMSQTITVRSSQEEIDRAEDDRALPGNGSGAVFYEDGAYRGDAWAVGFGRDSFSSYDGFDGWKHKDWNDDTTSIAVTPDADLTVYKETDHDGEDGWKVDESTSNVGKDWNDKISAYHLKNR
ncbi:hypothetical protein JJJ17_00095 [Paracoccus caeni]|uniref:Endonuclease/Exonuclease/phosphatase family protein n=1 Tax=Paracoccus caeni TaxID=657651 RepID=A0A934SBP3_9RHOB|nr:hypothetical protein [Paracoccus caeni]MBK4214314.1 hypothetical protein [Paracoccus caeni]